MRVGLGFDLHRLVEGRPLVLGGVKMASAKGLAGHSDADVLLHAICDALLGAVGEGDIGLHFPDTDPKWRGASSRLFVKEALATVQKKGYRVVNVDLVVLAETPKLAPYRKRIQKRIADMLSVEPACVNLKAKTMEGIGPVGEGQAIGAWAVVLLDERQGA
jgi:2-C-methyl-D-erythritol 2,4-cyclodiphosphate synthase